MWKRHEVAEAKAEALRVERHFVSDQQRQAAVMQQRFLHASEEAIASRAASAQELNLERDKVIQERASAMTAVRVSQEEARAAQEEARIAEITRVHAREALEAQRELLHEELQEQYAVAEKMNAQMRQEAHALLQRQACQFREELAAASKATVMSQAARNGQPIFSPRPSPVAPITPIAPSKAPKPTPFAKATRVPVSIWRISWDFTWIFNHHHHTGKNVRWRCRRRGTT